VLEATDLAAVRRFGEKFGDGLLEDGMLHGARDFGERRE